jgi:para-nitrobenzyl esterase
MRRSILIAVIFAVPVLMRAAPDVVTVEGGSLAGAMIDGVRQFRGIPYAAPPIRDLRWRPPEAIIAWHGVRDASEYGAECPQPQYPADSVYARPLRRQSEDCLFLNVWTTAKAGDKRPVFVWIHGGALTRGSSTSDVRDGAPLARKGVVLVAMNYRLGALGYLAHPELTAESPQHASGNYGVLDQIAALKWVQKNIAAFGGDPARVTIGGESAGSWSVNTLVASPLAKGLFIRAIGESGARFEGTPDLRADRRNVMAAEHVGTAAAKALGAESLKALRALPADQLLDVPGFRTQENVDGWVLPDEARTIFAQGRQNNVPVIVGSNANEMTSLATAAQIPKSMEEYRHRLMAQYGELAGDFDAAYGVNGDADIREAIMAAARDTIFSLNMRTWARTTTAAGSKAYLYLFSHIPPHPRRNELKAFHASELPYVFDVLNAGDPREAGFAYTDVDRRLAAQMSSYWVNFVTTGDPNGKGLPHWAAYNGDAEPYLEFGDPIASGQHLFKTMLDFQERALERSRR